MPNMTLRFEDDAEMADFVRSVEGTDGPLHPAIERAADDAAEHLAEAGWTRHGYIDDVYCPPGMIYDSHYGVCEPDDPRVIAGRWVCTCGYETDRLAHADGHESLARQGVALDRPGPHEITEVERVGPRNREWGE